jgi:50S ribosomal subunit-associated GTPase HflX
LLVHVRDIAHPQSEDQKTDVLGVLAQLSKDAGDKSPPILEAWNKIDLLDEDTRIGRLRAEAAGQGQRRLPPVALSAEREGGRPCSRQSIARPSPQRASSPSPSLPMMLAAYARRSRRTVRSSKKAPTTTAISRCALSCWWKMRRVSHH